MSSVNAPKQIKKHNWDFQWLQPLGKSLGSSASSANPNLCTTATPFLVPQWCYWEVPSLHQHSLLLYPFHPKIKTNYTCLGFLQHLALQVTKHWSFLCFCFSSLISCLACMFSDLLKKISLILLLNFGEDCLSSQSISGHLSGIWGSFKGSWSI